MKRLRIRNHAAFTLAMVAPAAVLALALPSGTQRAYSGAPAQVRAAVSRHRIPFPHIAIVHPRAKASVSKPPSIRAVADRYGVPASTLGRVLRWASLVRKESPHHTALLLAIVAVESRGESDVYTPAPDGTWSAGLAQVDSVNWATHGLTWDTAVNPAANLRAASAILRAYIASYGQWGALNAYNSGSPTGAPAYAAAVWAWLPATRAAVERGVGE